MHMIQKREWQTNNVPSSHYYSLCKFKVGVCVCSHTKWALIHSFEEDKHWHQKRKKKRSFATFALFSFDDETMKGFSDIVTQMQGWELRSSAVCTFFFCSLQNVRFVSFCVCVCAFVFMHYSVFSLLVFFGTCWITFFLHAALFLSSPEKLFRSRLVTVQTCALSVVVRRI